ncbi:dTDP-4-dehydrorhamnose reductase [Paenibacillus silvae]|uniref:dTDP-4-dehydrorhamnose reductase n=1 Tax=Paenibacillus silvae TaxID=1325358 RepID=UPI002005B0C3|nr:dTDP-4-dehydrorhamnose reductase [Paenibacillus silvae]MCK6075618.1 dTDP-4-dehydrorhamnose reductase [Paenibacillus silvae]MCK6150005.1 dTDP-4-dehydrorhamnose reductase [Paenibacillus silvae]MCK6268303.1 dTDP-4-dehydrorhamnose reductase [Paenibacillus silvae]
MKHRIIVTGAAGQLGYDVVKMFEASGHEVLACDRDQMDITDQQQCIKQVEAFCPDVIIHCAAYTAVDQAESDVDTAFAINAAGTRNITVAAEKVKAKLVYISTDYVFDGKGDTPYQEYDVTHPQSVYGKSKLAGELLVQSLSTRWFIIRTSWVFGRYGQNFVRTMLDLMEKRPELQVVHDQQGSPTYTVDLAHLVSELALSEQYGIYHASNSGSCTWFEFAQAIAEEASRHGVIEAAAHITPCTTAQFPRPAPRPAYSVMDHLGIRINGLQPMRHWREALIAFLYELKMDQSN